MKHAGHETLDVLEELLNGKRMMHHLFGLAEIQWSTFRQK
jgi:hypothetical protein